MPNIVKNDRRYTVSISNGHNVADTIFTHITLKSFCAYRDTTGEKDVFTLYTPTGSIGASIVSINNPRITISVPASPLTDEETTQLLSKPAHLVEKRIKEIERLKENLAILYSDKQPSTEPLLEKLIRSA